MGAGIVSLYSDVKSTTVNWLWYPFIVVGKISLLQGDTGDGKAKKHSVSYIKYSEIA